MVNGVPRGWVPTNLSCYPTLSSGTQLLNETKVEGGTGTDNTINEYAYAIYGTRTRGRQRGAGAGRAAAKRARDLSQDLRRKLTSYLLCCCEYSAFLCNVSQQSAMCMRYCGDTDLHC
jgi:hypothetical protein